MQRRGGLHSNSQGHPPPPIETHRTRSQQMTAVEQHANVWMIVRRNSEGVVSVIRSFRTERAALNAMGRLS